MNNSLNQLLIFEQTKGNYTEEETDVIYNSLRKEFKLDIISYTQKLSKNPAIYGL